MLLGEDWSFSLGLRFKMRLQQVNSSNHDAVSEKAGGDRSAQDGVRLQRK